MSIECGVPWAQGDKRSLLPLALPCDVYPVVFGELLRV